MTIMNSAVNAVMDLIDAMNLYAPITRGALGTGKDLVCDIAPSGAEEVYLDKNQYIVIDLTINGKHGNLQTLSEDLNKIQEELTMRREYPDGEDWQIVDITTLTEPQIIGREDSNDWVMASSLAVKVLTMKTPQP